MEFCEKCGGLMVPKKSGDRVFLECRSCGNRKETEKKDFKMSNVRNNMKGKILVLDEKSKIDVLPKTDATCPKCGNAEALWWFVQMRAADEPPTKFLRCTKCSHVWREYG
jgi:DNA-directed RNA polymerase subunit M